MCYVQMQEKETPILPVCLSLLHAKAGRKGGAYCVYLYCIYPRFVHIHDILACPCIHGGYTPMSIWKPEV